MKKSLHICPKCYILKKLVKGDEAGSYRARGEFPLRIVPTRWGRRDSLGLLLCVANKKRTQACTKQANHCMR